MSYFYTYFLLWNRKAMMLFLSCFTIGVQWVSVCNWEAFFRLFFCISRPLNAQANSRTPNICSIFSIKNLSRRWSSKTYYKFLFISKSLISWVCVYSFPRAAITKHHRLALKNRNFISLQFWKLKVQDQGVGRMYVFWRLLSLACLPVSSPGLPSVSVSVLISSYQDTSHVGLGPTHITSFHLNHLFKGPIAIPSHTLGYWGLGLRPSTYEFWRGHSSAHNSEYYGSLNIPFRY